MYRVIMPKEKKMKKFAKSLAFAAAFALATSAFAEVELSFENEVSSDLVTITSNDDDTTKDFAGISNSTTVTLTSERVDAELSVEYTIDDYGEKHFALTMTDVDGYIEFRPVDTLSLCFHDNIFADGSLLPIYDDNLSAGNIGSNGITVVFRPVEGLRIGASAVADMGVFNYFNGKEEDDEDEEFAMNGGVLYTADIFTAGFAVQDVIDSDDRSFGVYGTLNMESIINQKMTIGGGVSMYEAADGFDDLDFSGEAGVGGETLINAFLTWDLDAFALTAEVLTNTDKEQSTYDFYTAASVEFGVTEEVGLAVTGLLMMDNGNAGYDALENILGVEADLSFAMDEHNEFSAGVAAEFCDETTFFKFPVSWVYSF